MEILVSENNIVLFIDNNIKFGLYEGEEKWKINEYLYAIDNNYSCIKVECIPKEVQPYKYCYTEQDGFYLNPNWVEPPKPTEQIVSELQSENAALKEKLDLLISKLNIEL